MDKIVKINQIFEKSSDFNYKDKKLIKENGVVFTNKNICDKIIKKINPRIDEIICEPSVGKGVFVFSLLEYFREKHNIDEVASFFNNNLYCYDINDSFLTILKTLIVDYFNIFNYKGHLSFNNIITGDFLLQKTNYDVTIGNPPYVRIQNIEKNYLNELKSELKSITLGNVDLYYAFLEKSLLHSKRVGFIIPNSFIKNKSGSFIRDIIKERLTYLYDFKNEKVWRGISTYTSIVICGNQKTDDVQYETSDLTTIKNKNELSTKKWIFESLKVGSNKLVNLINSHSGGLATIKDSVFKMDSHDDLYCYKDGQPIEKDICKKYIKATKSKNFNDYRYIIYPYINGSLIDEQTMRDQYPLCYEYLLNKKEVLQLRDKGKTSKYDGWYAYGRRQGLLKEKTGECIVLPITFLKSRGVHHINIPDNEECLVLSGILVDIKKDMKNNFIDIIKNEDFYNFCEMNNKTLSDNNKTKDIWLGITPTTLKDYTH
jgi:hypothetical protein